ncbi:MAG TPA: hypothetical protein VFU21_26265, partial [Kofleriaceae bacterium]|nr:hypothetical protein [Kofleriaceae bacterium]
MSLPGLAELPSLDLVEECVERPIQHLGEIARRHLVAEERLRHQELLPGRLTDGELEREPLGCEGRHLRGRDVVLTGWFRDQFHLLRTDSRANAPPLARSQLLRPARRSLRPRKLSTN